MPDKGSSSSGENTWSPLKNEDKSTRVDPADYSESNPQLSTSIQSSPTSDSTSLHSSFGMFSSCDGSYPNHRSIFMYFVKSKQKPPFKVM